MSTFKSLARSVVTVGLSGIAGQVISFLALPVLSRLYSPDEFGVWALFVSTGLLIGSVATLRYELAVVLPHRDGAGAALLLAGLTFATMIAALTALFVGPIGRLAFGEGEFAHLGYFVWLLPVFVFAAACVQLGLAWCTRRTWFAIYSAGQFALPSATVGLQMLSVFLGFGGAQGLILGFVAGYVTTAAVLWGPIVIRDRALVSRGLSLRRIFALARRYFQYPLYMTPYTIISTLRDRAIYFLIGRFGDTGIVGYYSLAQRFTNLPNSFVSGALRPVFFQHAARRDLASLGEGVFAIMVALIVLTVPNLVVFWFHAETFLSVLFGAKWSGAAPYAIALSMPAFALLLGNWFDRALDISGRQRLAFAMEAVFSLVTVAALLIGFVLSGDIWYAVIVQTVAMTVYFSTWIAIVFKIARFRSSASLQVFGSALVLIAVCAGVLWVLESVLSVWWALGVYYLTYLAIAGAVAASRLRVLKDAF